ILATQFNNNVHSNLLFVLSYVPFISSFMMPIRIIYEVASTWEILISISITVGFLIGILILIRRIYPRLILQTDDSVFKALKKAMMK
ncbi:MAG: ABC transporter permease, partial [Lactobacillus iners]|nr:ABC transporter permease [Lactobacillus iners]